MRPPAGASIGQRRPPGTGGRGHFAGVARLRAGTLAQVGVNGRPCAHHAAEFPDQAREDREHAGTSSVHERGGVPRSFWPPESPPLADVTMTVVLSTGEYASPGIWWRRGPHTGHRALGPSQAAAAQPFRGLGRPATSGQRRVRPSTMRTCPIAAVRAIFASSIR